MLVVEAVAKGGPNVLQVAERPVPEPGPGEILIRHAAIGLNFIDTYHRSGLYPVDFPTVLGLEGAGVVEDPGRRLHHRAFHGVPRDFVGDVFAEVDEDVGDVDGDGADVVAGAAEGGGVGE